MGVSGEGHNQGPAGICVGVLQAVSPVLADLDSPAAFKHLQQTYCFSRLAVYPKCSYDSRVWCQA